MSEFVRHLERASGIVSGWPEWKRNVLGGRREAGGQRWLASLRSLVPEKGDVIVRDREANRVMCREWRRDCPEKRRAYYMANREKMLAYQTERRAKRKEEAAVSMMRDLKSASEVVMEVAGVLEKFAGKEVPLHIVVGDMRLAAEVMRLTGEDLVGRLVRGKYRQQGAAAGTGPRQGAAAGTEPMGHKTA